METDSLETDSLDFGDAVFFTDSLEIVLFPIHRVQGVESVGRDQDDHESRARHTTRIVGHILVPHCGSQVLRSTLGQYGN